MTSFGHIGLHAGENLQAVLQFQGVPRSSAHRGDVAIHVGKLEGVEVLCQAQGVQPGPPGLAEEPVGVNGRKGELFGQLPVGVKINAQGYTFFQAVEKGKAFSDG